MSLDDHAVAGLERAGGSQATTSVLDDFDHAHSARSQRSDPRDVAKVRYADASLQGCF